MAGVYMSQHLSLLAPWEGREGTSQGQNRTREIRPSGIVGGLAETWAMEKGKRARKAETPKQPSLCLRLRAPHFYPTISGGIGYDRGVDPAVELGSATTTGAHGGAGGVAVVGTYAPVQKEARSQEQDGDWVLKLDAKN